MSASIGSAYVVVHSNCQVLVAVLSLERWQRKQQSAFVSVKSMASHRKRMRWLDSEQ
jgi:hypothetical protein